MSDENKLIPHEPGGNGKVEVLYGSRHVAAIYLSPREPHLYILPFQGADSYDYMLDMDNYIETQAKVLTSETLALQTIRNSGLAGNPEFSSDGAPSEAIDTGTLANQ